MGKVDWNMFCVINTVCTRAGQMGFFISLTGHNTSHVSVLYFVFLQAALLYSSVYPRHYMLKHVDQSINSLNPRKRENSPIFEWPVWSVILNSGCACEWSWFSVSVGSIPFSRTEPLPTWINWGYLNKNLQWLSSAGRKGVAHCCICSLISMSAGRMKGWYCLLGEDSLFSRARCVHHRRL